VSGIYCRLPNYSTVLIVVRTEAAAKKGLIERVISNHRNDEAANTARQHIEHFYSTSQFAAQTVLTWRTGVRPHSDWEKAVQVIAVHTKCCCHLSEQCRL